MGSGLHFRLGMTSAKDIGAGNERGKVKRGARVTLSFLLGALILWLFLGQLEFGRVLDAMGEADPVWLFVAVFMQGVHLVIRSLRWRVLLSPLKRGISFYNLFSTTAMGYVLSLVFFRIGEVVRPLLLGQREKISKSATVATCLLERLMDSMTVALLFGFYMVFLFEPPAEPSGAIDLAGMRRSALVLGLAILGAFPILYVVVRSRRTLLEFLDLRMGRRSFLLRVLHGFLSGFDAVSRGRIMTTAWLQSVVIWLVIAAAISASMRAFDLDAGFGDSLLVLALLTFGIAVPVPGGVGALYLGQLGLVEFFGVEPNRAAATILATQTIIIGPVIIIGTLLLWKEGLGFAGLSQIQRRVKSARDADSNSG